MVAARIMAHGCAPGEALNRFGSSKSRQCVGLSGLRLALGPDPVVAARQSHSVAEFGRVKHELGPYFRPLAAWTQKRDFGDPAIGSGPKFDRPVAQQD
jgi:hypothetical protein